MIYSDYEAEWKTKKINGARYMAVLYIHTKGTIYHRIKVATDKK